MSYRTPLSRYLIRLAPQAQSQLRDVSDANLALLTAELIRLTDVLPRSGQKSRPSSFEVGELRGLFEVDEEDGALIVLHVGPKHL